MNDDQKEVAAIKLCELMELNKDLMGLDEARKLVEGIHKGETFNLVMACCFALIESDLGR